MRLGLNLGYWGADASQVVDVARHAESLGFHSVWTAEAYGSDAVVPLTWVGAQTSKIGLGTAIMQMPARSPAMTAMTAATLDTLSNGRFRLGLGVSGPQVSEGWHGVRFDRPLARTREYVDIVRMALRRDRVRYAGETYQLPLPDGPGKALTLTVHPVREHVPVYLAAVGPKNLELAGEIADGWLAIFFAPGFAGDLLTHVRAGLARSGRPVDGFDVVPTAPLVVGPDWTACADAVRPYAALYVGGMGSRKRNFYNELAVRMGFAEQAATVQDRYLARDYAAAAAAVPVEFLDATSLLGPKERIRDGMRAFAEAGVTTLSLALMQSDPGAAVAAVRTAAEALDAAGVGD
jgi:F420-dependent oxidoreductase-like protein